MFRPSLLVTILFYLLSAPTSASQITEGINAYASAQYEIAYTLLLQSERTADVRRNYYLGLMNAKGLGRSINKREARYYFELAAQEGHLDAMHELGKLYSTGRLKAEAYSVAALWFEKAASKGHVDSQFSLGKLYLNGKGVSKDRELAERLFLRAANGENIDAQLMMATNTTDIDEKLGWLTKAANQGDYRAQKSLGDVFMANHDLTDSEQNALHWYQLAASNGSDTANVALGKLFETGSDAIQSDDEALKWYKRAMELDLSIARFHVESLTQKKCIKSANTKVIALYIFCASRDQIQQSVIDYSGVVDYLVSTPDEDVFNNVKVYDAESKLTIYYDDAKVEKLDFSFDSQSDSDDYQKIFQVLSNQYGEYNLKSDDNVSPKTTSWVMQDKVKITLITDEAITKIVLRFEKVV